MAVFLFFSLLPFATVLTGWFYAGYFNGRYDQ